MAETPDNFPASTPEWSHSDDTKLLQLAKLMPSQWNQIAALIGRSPKECQERYRSMVPPPENCGDALDVSNNTDATLGTFEDEELGISTNGPSSLMKTPRNHETREKGNHPVFMEFADSEGIEKAGVVSRKTKKLLGAVACALLLLLVGSTLTMAGRKETSATSSNTSTTTIAPTLASTLETTEEVQPDFVDPLDTAAKYMGREQPQSNEVTPEQSTSSSTVAPTLEQTEESTAAIYPQLIMPGT